MSAIIQIFAIIAGLPVTVNGITPQVFNVDNLPNAIAPSQAPCRLLLPLDDESIAVGGQFQGLGTLTTVSWRITDLMLWAPAVKGAGIHDYAETLVAYAGAYMEMLRKVRSPVVQGRITNMGARPGRFQYPLRTGRWWLGAKCTVDVQEILSSAVN